ncbi:effector-associated constant component EACC1 [Streptomyces durocortorensis]|uniref:Uncharacterized protein n=1 Tax=Streptomyces durocortorensis TaxID=2811104 RepID=A0ABS2HQI2_9ACTN|nr:hypothetical protein [Streptomyces durocortorensis]MBM7052573.1 hypothetical protein [Streptomyces durocortorensis]
MDILVEIEGGQGDELRVLERALREDPDLYRARVSRSAGEVEPGALGAEAVIQFIGENVLLPALLTAIYDHLTARRRTRSGMDLKATVARTDLPDGTRRVELTLEGPASEVVEAARKELE